MPRKQKKEMFDALNQPFTNPPQPLHPIVNQNTNQIEIPQNYPPQNTNNNSLQEQNFQLVDMFPDMADDPLNEDHFLEAIQ